jgi:hypothetical protein
MVFVDKMSVMLGQMLDVLPPGKFVVLFSIPDTAIDGIDGNVGLVVEKQSYGVMFLS